MPCEREVVRGKKAVSECECDFDEIAGGYQREGEDKGAGEQ